MVNRYTSVYCLHYTKGINFCDFLFASVNDIALPKMGSTLNPIELRNTKIAIGLKKRICSQRGRLFPLIVEPCREGR